MTVRLDDIEDQDPDDLCAECHHERRCHWSGERACWKRPCRCNEFQPAPQVYNALYTHHRTEGTPPMSDRTPSNPTPDKAPVEEIAAADYRRAAVLLNHWSADNAAGVNVVLEELTDTQRITQAFIALLSLVGEIVPPIRDPQARAAIGRMALRFARAEEQERAGDAGE